MPIKLSLNEKRKFLNSLISGIVQFKFEGKLYTVRPPNYQLIQDANNIYNCILSDNRFDNWLKEEDIEEILMKQELWDSCNDIKIKRLSETLNDYRVDLYKCYCTNPDGVKRCHRLISQIKNLIQTAFSNKYSLYKWTLYYYAEIIKQRYITIYTIYNNNKRVYSDDVQFQSTSFYLLDNAVNAKSSLNLEDSMIRYLVKNEPWKTLWTIGKPNPFKSHYTELTETQKSILMFSKMYDNILANPNCPPEEIIEDDDALDGWLLEQNRIYEQQKLDSKVQDNLKGRQKMGMEIFLPVKNAEEAKKIEQLNTPDVQMIKKQRQNLIQQKGVVQDKDFLDQRLNRQVMINQGFIDHARK
jgi:hypothetical protein